MTKRKSKCDLKGGWPECWNTECRWHGKPAKRWHEIRKTLADAMMSREEAQSLRAEEKAMYEKLTVEPVRRVRTQEGK